MTATVEETGETVTHDVTQAYRVDGTLVEFVPTDDAPGYRYRVRVDGTNTQEWVSDDHQRPSKSLAVFFYEKVENSRYVLT